MMSLPGLALYRLSLHDALPIFGRSRIELLEATAPESPIARFLAKRGPGLHHLTLSVPNLAERLRALEQSGVRLIDPKPRRGADRKSTRLNSSHLGTSYVVFCLK